MTRLEVEPYPKAGLSTMTCADSIHGVSPEGAGGGEGGGGGGGGGGGQSPVGAVM